MLNKERHQLIMGRLIKDIYTDVSLSSLLGFKGGSCAYFFYGLSRFSVDLDFDLLKTDQTDQENIFNKIKEILKDYGTIKDEHIKKYTIFFLLTYGEKEHNIKIEINTRKLVSDIYEHYELKDYLGISVLAGKRDYLFASKLLALTGRKETVMRDIYDIWFFAKKNWDINRKVIKEREGVDIKDHIDKCIEVIESVEENRILTGLGELLDDKSKSWIKNNLKQETIFLLKNYQSAMNE